AWAGISGAESGGGHKGLAELYRLKGELLGLKHNRLADSEACVREALAIAARQGALSLELRAATSLCRIMRARREATQGTDVLASVLARLQEGRDTADGRAARAVREAREPYPPVQR